MDIGNCHVRQRYARTCSKNLVATFSRHTHDILSSWCVVNARRFILHGLCTGPSIPTVFVAIMVAIAPAAHAVDCISAVSDSDGDGWGWENGLSCVVTESSNADHNSVSDLLCVDPDGDGWGWDGTRSCIVEENSVVDDDPYAGCDYSAAASSNGYGWNPTTQTSCAPEGNTGNINDDDSNHQTVDDGDHTLCDDPDGDGWGWTGSESCQVESVVADVDDPSALRPLRTGDLDEGLTPANEGAFAGGNTATKDDVVVQNVIAKEQQRGDGLYFNIPTNGPPSPLFGIAPFTQKMLRFEEFGSLPINWQADNNGLSFPVPTDTTRSPDGAELDNFLAQEDISPLPSRLANTDDTNPWKTQIEGYLGRPLSTPPAEGRPPGQGWAHQRWDEFTPQNAAVTAQSGARANGGFRDERQHHGYLVGEFGPGGLYHNTTGQSGFEGTTSGIEVKFHPQLPVQEANTLWTFDGTFPPKLLKSRYGEPILFRHYNGLPIDVSANRGFGLHTLSTHEHNGHNPAESDGFTNAFFFPGQYYDYRWPMTLAGHDSINTQAEDPRAGRPDGDGGIIKIPGDYRETMSTHWFHDHMLDFTAQNVYKGNVAMMNYYSALDRGNEGLDDGVNLRLPSGTALDWGNRDYDVNLMLAEKSWDSEGQLWFNPFNQAGFLGDVMTVNWMYKPDLEVRARKYRFRILNGSVSRYFKLALIDDDGNRVPFHMIANDGNIMEHTVLFDDGELPTLGVAERYDIIVDFSQFEAGTNLYFVNLLQHRNGQSTDAVIPLEDVLDGSYAPVRHDQDGDGVADSWEQGDPVVGKFLQFTVREYDGEDLSLNPAEFVEGGEKLIPLHRPTADELENATHRTFEFEKQPTDDTPWVIETDGGKGFSMDPRRLSAAPKKNSSGLEVWRLLNSGSWSHPIHIHFEEGIVLRRNGKPPPPWERWARKDVYRLGPQPDSGDSVEIALRFREFAGTFMEHCHNTQHEDHAMLLRWDIENPGQTLLMPAPIPSWDGVSYVDTVALPTFREGDGTGQFGPSLDDQAVSIWVAGAEVEEIDLVNVEIGDATNPTDDERGVVKIPLRRGVNIDAEGNEREVWFVLHDMSDQALAEQMGLAWAGGLVDTPIAATSEASVSESGVYTFFGDLPNPVIRMNAAFTHLDSPDTPAQRQDNTYSPLRRVNIGGKDVVVNAFFVVWGDQQWEHLRIDENCIAFPDEPPNTSCRYNGQNWGGDTGHALEINTADANPYVKLKLHKSWSEEGDYLPYYIVVDSFPAGPANNMGVIYVPKHEHLSLTAVPLVQFLPNQPLSGGYPPTPLDFNALQVQGGGPLGGQIGIPSYFMPEDDYSPMWHIGFAHWLEPADRVVKGLLELKQLRDQGKLMIHEWPAVRVGENDYDFNSLNPPHVVNCPTPVTIDRTLHKVNKQQALLTGGQ